MTQEPLEPWDDDVSALLAAEKASPAPRAEVQDRIWRNVALAGGVVAGASHGSGAAAQAAGVLNAAARRAVLMGALLSGGTGLLGGAFLHAWLAEPVERVVTVERVVERVVQVPAPVQDAPATPPAASTRVVAAPAPRAARAERKVPTVAAPSDADALDREAALLERARTALLRGSHADALDALKQHAAQFPEGMFAEEGAALEVQALARSGDGAGAARAAERFIARYPGSLHRRAVEEATRTR